MNVVDSNPNGNPSSDRASSPDELCRQIDQMAEAIKANVRRAGKSGDSFDSVERDIHKTLFIIGHQAANLFISLQGDGDLGES